MADYDIPVYPGTMRYNPQVKDHCGITIGCLIFHGLLMSESGNAAGDLEVFRASGLRKVFYSLSMGNKSYPPQFMMASSASISNAMGTTHMKTKTNAV